VPQTLPTVPDRSDLLRAFLSAWRLRRRPQARALIVGAFVLACSGVGFAL
jgi:hypothetical protein